MEDSIKKTTNPDGSDEISPKSRLTAALLAVFLGFFGIHRLYLGKTPSAYGMMALGIAGFSSLGITYSIRDIYLDGLILVIGAATLFIAVGIWSLVDFIIIVSGKMRDNDGKLIKQWQTSAPHS